MPSVATETALRRGGILPPGPPVHYSKNGTSFAACFRSASAGSGGPKAAPPRAAAAPYQVRSLRSSWICSRGTGSASMWSLSHFEKSFSIASLQRWSICPGV
jgi:hypothetical protein